MRILFAGSIMAAMFLSCQDPNNAGDKTAAVLQKTDFKVRTSGNPDFCYHIWDSTTVAYRNSDTLIIVVRSVAECPPYTLDHQIKNDTLELIYSLMDLHVCVDTMRYTYLEYGFKILREGNLRIIVEDDISKCKCNSIDSAINTREAIKNYNISCN